MVYLRHLIHLSHKNLVRGCSEWDEQRKIYCRDFKTLKEHDDTIINSINTYIKKNDILYILGDFCLGGRENVEVNRNKINCKNIHIILGNHCQQLTSPRLLKSGLLTTDLFSSVQNTLEKKIRGVNFVMSHYAMRTWRNASTGSIMLHGHSHGSLPQYEKLLQIANDPILHKTGEYYKQMDVGIDCAYRDYGEYRPYKIEEVFQIMVNRINLDVDHHN